MSSVKQTFPDKYETLAQKNLCMNCLSNRVRGLKNLERNLSTRSLGLFFLLPMTILMWYLILSRILKLITGILTLDDIYGQSVISSIAIIFAFVLFFVTRGQIEGFRLDTSRIKELTFYENKSQTKASKISPDRFGISSDKTFIRAQTQIQLDHKTNIKEDIYPETKKIPPLNVEQPKVKTNQVKFEIPKNQIKIQSSDPAIQIEKAGRKDMFITKKFNLSYPRFQFFAKSHTTSENTYEKILPPEQTIERNQKDETTVSSINKDYGIRISRILKNRKDFAALTFVIVAVLFTISSFNAEITYESYESILQVVLLASGTTYAASPTIEKRNTWAAFPGLIRLLIGILAIISIIGPHPNQQVILEMIIIAFGRSFGSQYARFGNPPDKTNLSFMMNNIIEYAIIDKTLIEYAH